MKAVVICVDYGDLLRITLPRNVAYFEQIAIGTTPADTETQEIAAQFPNVVTYCTEAFYADGAKFNKGRVIEELFDIVGRDGWLCVLDADIVLPAEFGKCRYQPGLTTPERRLLEQAADYRDGLAWHKLPQVAYGWWGYCQIFNAADPVLKSRPWYPTDWSHAGGCDAEFSEKWPENRKFKAPFSVLHLGPCLANWCGRVSARLDGKPIPEAEDRRRQMQDARGGYKAEKHQREQQRLQEQQLRKR